VQSFNQPSLLKLHEQSPALPLVQLLWYYPDEKNATQLKEWTDVTPGSGNVDDADFQAIADYAVGIGTNFIYEGAPVISADFVDQAQDNDLRVHVYTVNDTDDMQQLLDWGVDGMFTNYPDQLLELTR
jgi:glycerophosphoryl diester phosphodiesterase